MFLQRPLRKMADPLGFLRYWGPLEELERPAHGLRSSTFSTWAHIARIDPRESIRGPAREVFQGLLE
jgi:hypothetical protein